MSHRYQASEVKWVELIPVLIGRYSVCVQEDKSGNITPCLYETREEAMAEIQDSRDIYKQQIDEGQRDPDDEYEGEVHPCVQDGDELVLLCEESLIETERVSWKPDI